MGKDWYTSVITNLGMRAGDVSNGAEGGNFIRGLLLRLGRKGILPPHNKWLAILQM